MPPPLLIESFHFLKSFERTNMVRKNDSAKFFSAPL